MGDGTKITERWARVYAKAGAIQREFGMAAEPWVCMLVTAIEELSAAEERERVLRVALGRTVWRERSQFPGNPFCVICGAGKKWTTIHGHESTCPLATPASTPPDANTSWFCVPCGFTTRDAAEAQAHLGPHMIEITCPFDGQIWRFHTQAQADMLQKHLGWHAAQKEGGQ